MSTATPTDHVADGLSWRETGIGKPVLFLHGLGGTRRSWEPQLRSLGARFRCIAWDMPGYGHSTPISRLTFSAIAGRLVDLLDALEVERVTLVGLSFGGMHALHTALLHPDRVERLVLADTSPAFGIDGTTREDWVGGRLAGLDAGGTLAEAAGPIIDSITASPLIGQVRAEIVGAFEEIPDAGFRAAVHCLPTHDVRDRLQDITQPTLIIVGELDHETPVEYSRLLADGIPDSKLHVLPAIGHLSPSEAPDDFNALVSHFVAAPAPGTTNTLPDGGTRR